MTSVNTTTELDLLLKQYEMLREEILASMNNRVQILSFGLAAVGVVLAAVVAAFNTSSAYWLAYCGLALAVPGIADAVSFIWLGEYRRSQRAGCFLYLLEEQVYLHKGTPDASYLNWEHYLRGKRLGTKDPRISQGTKMLSPYLAALVLLGLIGWLSIAFVFIPLLSLNTFLQVKTPVLIGTIVLLVAQSFVLETLRRMFEQVRSEGDP